MNNRTREFIDGQCPLVLDSKSLRLKSSNGHNTNTQRGALKRFNTKTSDNLSGSEFQISAGNLTNKSTKKIPSNKINTRDKSSGHTNPLPKYQSVCVDETQLKKQRNQEILEKKKKLLEEYTINSKNKRRSVKSNCAENSLDFNSQRDRLHNARHKRQNSRSCEEQLRIYNKKVTSKDKKERLFERKCSEPLKTHTRKVAKPYYNAIKLNTIKEKPVGGQTCSQKSQPKYQNMTINLETQLAPGPPVCPRSQVSTPKEIELNENQGNWRVNTFGDIVVEIKKKDMDQMKYLLQDKEKKLLISERDAEYYKSLVKTLSNQSENQESNNEAQSNFNKKLEIDVENYKKEVKEKDETIYKMYEEIKQIRLHLGLYSQKKLVNQNNNRDYRGTADFNNIDNKCVSMKSTLKKEVKFGDASQNDNYDSDNKTLASCQKFYNNREPTKVVSIKGWNDQVSVTHMSETELLSQTSFLIKKPKKQSMRNDGDENTILYESMENVKDDLNYSKKLSVDSNNIPVLKDYQRSRSNTWGTGLNDSAKKDSDTNMFEFEFDSYRQNETPPQIKVDSIIKKDNTMASDIDLDKMINEGCIKNALEEFDSENLLVGQTKRSSTPNPQLNNKIELVIRYETPNNFSKKDPERSNCFLIAPTMDNCDCNFFLDKKQLKILTILIVM